MDVKRDEDAERGPGLGPDDRVWRSVDDGDIGDGDGDLDPGVDGNPRVFKPVAIRSR
jgi:hypothetical protein